MNWDTIAGIGLGLFTGLCIGLSASPVVGAVIGTLMGLVGVFVGIDFGDADPGHAAPFRGKVNTRRLGAFAIAASAALLLGIFIRANNLLSGTSPLETRRDELLAVGFTETDARDMIRAQVANEPAPVADEPAPARPDGRFNSAAYAAHVRESECGQMKPDSFGDSSNPKTLARVLRVYEEQKGVWLLIAQVVKEHASDPSAQFELLRKLHRLVCMR